MKSSADISKAIDTLSARRGHCGVKGNASAWRPAFEKLNDQINHIKVSYKNRNQILKRTHTDREGRTQTRNMLPGLAYPHSYVFRKPTPLKVLINKVLERQVHTHRHTPRRGTLTQTHTMDTHRTGVHNQQTLHPMLIYPRKWAPKWEMTA